MKELTRQQKLEAWKKVLEYFKENFSKGKYPGLCRLISGMHVCDKLSLREYRFTTKEIEDEIEVKRIKNNLLFKTSSNYLFDMFEYQPRLKYLESKIKKYSDQSEAAETL